MKCRPGGNRQVAGGTMHNSTGYQNTGAALHREIRILCKLLPRTASALQQRLKHLAKTRRFRNHVQPGKQRLRMHIVALPSLTCSGLCECYINPSHVNPITVITSGNIIPCQINSFLSTAIHRKHVPAIVHATQANSSFCRFLTLHTTLYR